MLKLVAVDLDRTLLRNDKSISCYTKYVFSKLWHMGIRTVINSVRPYGRVKWVISDIYADSVICCNGAEVYCSGKKIAEHFMENSTVINVLQEAGECFSNIQWSVTDTENTYVNYPDPYYTCVADVKDFLSSKTLMIIIRNVMEEEYHRFSSRMEGNGVHIGYLEKRNVIVTDKEVSKEKGLNFIRKRYGICWKDVVAFGDDVNDIGFMYRSGVSVAVGNADVEVKRVADFMCDSNEFDGVARWLAEYYKI